MTKGNKKNVKSQQKTKATLSPLDWPIAEKWTLGLVIGVIAIVSLSVFWRFVTGQDLFIFDDKGSDAITLFYPNLVHMARYYQEVGFPGWSFYLGLGQSFFPGGLLNPWDLLYTPMGPKTIAVAIGFMQWFKIIATGLVFGLFLRKLGLSAGVIVIGSLMYALGGYLVVGSSWYIHSTHIFWFTVSFLAFEMLLKDQRWWLMPVPFLFLVGTRAYFLVLFFIVYAAVRTLDHYDWNWRNLLKVYGRMLICGCIALLLAAPFISEKFYKLYNSARVTGNVSKVESLSAKPILALGNEKQNGTAILRWFSNDILGTADAYAGYRNYLEGPLFYIGLLSLLLVPQFFFLAGKKKRLLFGGLLLFWFLILLFPWLRYAFYAFAGDYYKGALSLFVPFSVLLIALLALDKMVKGSKPNMFVLLGSLVFLLCLVWYPYPSLQQGIQPDIQLLVSLFLVAEAAWLALMHTSGIRKYALPVLLGLVAIETGTLSWKSYATRNAIPATDLRKPVNHFDNTHLAIDWIKAQQNPLFYRVEKAYGSVKSGFNDALVQDFFGTKTYQSHNSKYYIRFMEEMGIIPKGNQASSKWLVGFNQRNTLHPLLSIQYFLANEEGNDKINRSIYEKIESTQNIDIYKNKYFIPFGIPFTSYYLESEFLPLDPSQKLEAIYHGIVVPDDQASAVAGMTHQDLASMNFGSGISATWQGLADKAMKMTYFSHSLIKGEVNMESKGILFLSIPYEPSWQIIVDGKPETIELVDLGFSGIYLEAGNHTIEMKYVPPYSKQGWIIFGIALLAVALLLWKKVKLLPITT